MKKTTLIGATALLAAAAMFGGCASDSKAVAESNGQKAACCGDKSAEAKAGTCTGEAKASATCVGEAKATGACTGEAKSEGCCKDKAGSAQVK